MANIDRAIAIADRLVDEAPERLRGVYVFGAEQPRRTRAVIARVGRHPHRDAVLGRPSTPEKLAYLNDGEFPHTSKIAPARKQSRDPHPPPRRDPGLARCRERTSRALPLAMRDLIVETRDGLHFEGGRFQSVVG